MNRKNDKPQSNLSEFLKISNYTETTAEIHFYGDIVDSEWYAWEDTDTYPLQVKEFLDQVQGKDLNIYIKSGGGSVFAGMSIYNMLKRHTGNKIVHVDGLAGSIASVIALAGDKVIMPSNSYFMIHKPMYGLWGNYNANEFRDMADTLDRIEEGIINVYKDNLVEGVDIETIRNFVNEETWFTGEEASKYFNIEVSDSLEAVACESNLYDKYNKKPINILNKAKEEKENLNLGAIASARLRFLNLKNKEI